LGENGVVDRSTTTEPASRVPDPRPDRAGRVAGIVGLVALAAVAATLAGPWQPPLKHETAVPFSPPPVPSSSPTPFELIPTELLEQDIRPWDLTWLGLGLGAVVVAWVAFLVLRWLHRHPGPPEPEGPDDLGVAGGAAIAGPGVVLPDLPALREGVADADLALRRFARPADAVIAAWVRLEEAAAHSGVLRDPAATPTEFTLTVLDAAPVDPQATRVLLELYLRARFGGEHMTAGDVASATGALATLSLGLGEGGS
jgi:hypothetical protein